MQEHTSGTKLGCLHYASRTGSSPVELELMQCSAAAADTPLGHMIRAGPPLFGVAPGASSRGTFPFLLCWICSGTAIPPLRPPREYVIDFVMEIWIYGGHSAAPAMDKRDV